MVLYLTSQKVDDSISPGYETIDGPGSKVFNIIVAIHDMIHSFRFITMKFLICL